jgi:hypothetical protein
LDASLEKSERRICVDRKKIAEATVKINLEYDYGSEKDRKDDF